MKKLTKSVLCLTIAALILAASATAMADSLLIGIPDDGTNLSRGIKLLETAGLIEVDPAVGYTPELKDVTKYIYDIEIMPTTANTLPSTLGDFAASTINGTYAVPNGLVPSKDGLLIEKQSEGGDNPYVNIIAARTADVDNETYKTVVDAFKSQLVAEFLLVNYKETFYPAFEYDADPEDGFITEEECRKLVEYVSDKGDKTVVKVGVCGANNDQWKAAQYVLDQNNAGIYIELVEFDAYNLPNEALNAGDIDLNSFQHIAYLNNDAGNNGYDITPIGDTLIAPLTLYSQRFSSIDEIKEAAGLK